MREAIEGPIHFIGIGGSGMAGLAELALSRGFEVQGTDLKASTAVTRLRGSARALLSITPPHHWATRRRRLLVRHQDGQRRTRSRSGQTSQRPSSFRVLAYLMAGKSAITIAGTHGKSTTSAMVTHMLDSLGLDPVAAIGATMRRYDRLPRPDPASISSRKPTNPTARS